MGLFYNWRRDEWCPWSERAIVSSPCLFLAARPHGTDKASWSPGNAGKGATWRSEHLPVGVVGERMSKRGEELLDAGMRCLCSGVKSKPCKRLLLWRPDCATLLLFSHGHGSSRRFEGISLFLSSARVRAHSPSKAQRPEPAQNSYELNPQPAATSYSNNANPGNSGNGASDDFYDEVFHPHVLTPVLILTKVVPPVPNVSLGRRYPAKDQRVQGRLCSDFWPPYKVPKRCGWERSGPRVVG